MYLFHIINATCYACGQTFVNLQTANYILHGLQHYADSEPAWRDTFWRGFGLHMLDPSVRDDPEKLCTHVVRWCITPFGVVSSETSHRGGEQQAVAMVVDGRVERGNGLRNFWGQGESATTCAGDELILILERVPMNFGALQEELERWTYILPNRNDRENVKMTFPVAHPPWMQRPLPKDHAIWQLVPSVASTRSEAFCKARGYWRIGMVY